MIKVEHFYCCSLKNASIVFAWGIIAFQLLQLISIILIKTGVVVVEDDVDLGKFVISDESFYTEVVVFILWILAAVICYYGVEKKKPNFMIPIIVLIPLGIVLQLISLGISFTGFSLAYFIIGVLLFTYAWICFFTYWQQLKKSLTLDMNVTKNSMNTNMNIDMTV